MPAPNVTVTQNVQEVQTTLNPDGTPTGLLQTGGQVFGQMLTVAQAEALLALVSQYATGLWVNRPSSPTLNFQYFATDIGPNGVNFYWNGTRWKVFYPTVIAENGAIVTGVAQLADQYIGTGFGPFPVGLIAAGDVIQYQFAFGKTGATDGTTVLVLQATDDFKLTGEARNDQGQTAKVEVPLM
jgi:hypothetical protein